MTDDEKTIVAEAVSTLLLSDHMKDAHYAGALLAKLLWGKPGEDDYYASAGKLVTPEMRERLVKRVPIWDERPK